MSDPVLYHIEHVSRYTYTLPIRHCMLSLCLRPRSDAGQRLVAFDLATDPPAAHNSETDIFGNTKHVLNVHGEHASLELVTRSTVERQQPAELPDSLGPDAWEEVRSWRDSFDYWDFTHPSAYARPSPALAAFVEERHIAAGDDPLASLLRLSDTLHDSFEFAPGSTSAASPIEETLASRKGVCQDYAHVMIAIARSWHIPARYVSGYLYVESQDGEAATQYASHAWVECRLPGLGWVGFDPTNRCTAGRRHIRVGVGRDYHDVAPVRGIFLGGGSTRLEVEVRVRAEKDWWVATPQRLRASTSGWSSPRS